jgi:hypothetical protein
MVSFRIACLYEITQEQIQYPKKSHGTARFKTPGSVWLSLFIDNTGKCYIT